MHLAQCKQQLALFYCCASAELRRKRELNHVKIQPVVAKALRLNAELNYAKEQRSYAARTPKNLHYNDQSASVCSLNSLVPRSYKQTLLLQCTKTRKHEHCSALSMLSSSFDSSSYSGNHVVMNT